MGLYTYKCNVCGLEKDYEMKPSEVPLKQCECGAENPERIWSSSVRQVWNTDGRCGTSTLWNGKY